MALQEKNPVSKILPKRGFNVICFFCKLKIKLYLERLFGALQGSDFKVISYDTQVHLTEGTAFIDNVDTFVIIKFYFKFLLNTEHTI